MRVEEVKVLAGEGDSPRQEFIEEDSHRVEICALIEREALRLFGGYVGERAKESIAGRRARLKGPCGVTRGRCRGPSA